MDMNRIIPTPLLRAATVALPGLAAGPWTAPAAPLQAVEKGSGIRTEEPLRRKRVKGIQGEPIGAVAVAERERRNEARWVSFAWPGTLSAGGGRLGAW